MYTCGSVATKWPSKAFPRAQPRDRRGCVFMKSVLGKLTDQEEWLAFLHYKKDRRLMGRAEMEELEDFIERQGYLPIGQAIQAGSFRFGIPRRRELNKMGTRKKRVVYTFEEDENWLLKFLAYLLYRYDGAMAPNCYAFRRATGVRRAFTDLASKPDIESYWCYRTDIRDYFNSIDRDILAGILREQIQDDPPLLDLLLDLLGDDRYLWQGEVRQGPKGAMAGTPTSPFFANLYLRELDLHFAEQGILYARYSDDIIVFDEKENLLDHAELIKDFFDRYRLRVNPDKEVWVEPGGAWSFLGFQYHRGEVDIAPASLKKLKGRIRRSARSLRRWMLRADAEPDRALKAFNRKFNRKFYSDSGQDLCWSRWYFPLLTRDVSLRAIDAYMQQYQRYIVTGKHNKANLGRVPYARLRACGYLPLVAAYYRKPPAGEGQPSLCLDSR